MKGYQPLVKFVKDSQNQIAKIIRDTKIPLESRKIFYEIMKTTYMNLKNFCLTNSENQKLLVDSLDFFLDELQFDFGQTDLVNAIFSNNKFLCENCKKTFEKMKRIIREQGRQRRFLEFFKVPLPFSPYLLPFRRSSRRPRRPNSSRTSCWWPGASCPSL